jgi:hypothetical protein
MEGVLAESRKRGIAIARSGTESAFSFQQRQ